MQTDQYMPHPPGPPWLSWPSAGSRGSFTRPQWDCTQVAHSVTHSVNIRHCLFCFMAFLPPRSRPSQSHGKYRVSITSFLSQPDTKRRSNYLGAHLATRCTQWMEAVQMLADTARSSGADAARCGRFPPGLEERAHCTRCPLSWRRAAKHAPALSAPPSFHVFYRKSERPAQTACG